MTLKKLVLYTYAYVVSSVGIHFECLQIFHHFFIAFTCCYMQWGSTFVLKNTREKTEFVTDTKDFSKSIKIIG